MKSTFYRWIYSLLLYVFIPLEIVRLLSRSRKSPEYRFRWSERFASKLPATAPEVIWFHTVSVGETLAALPVIRDTLTRFPKKSVLVTTMTPTGSERVTTLLGDSVIHCYAPYDLPHTMARFFRHLKPQVLCIMETELWPNMLHQACRRRVPTVLMNARLSEKSAKGYQRFASLTHDMLNKISHIAVQNHSDAERFIRLGANPEKMTVTGNIKFDLSLPDDLPTKLAELKSVIKNRPVWLAASTHQGEDEIILQAHQRLLEHYPQACLILVPRHPERFNSVHQLCVDTHLEVTRRSRSDLPTGAIYLADTMGELLIFCALADMAFVGGSLVTTGGHNCLEVAAFRKPVMSGPHDFNFAEINKSLAQNNALMYVTDAESLFAQLKLWLDFPDQAHLAGQAGYDVVESNRGALGKLLTILDQYFKV